MSQNLFFFWFIFGFLIIFSVIDSIVFGFFDYFWCVWLFLFSFCLFLVFDSFVFGFFDYFWCVCLFLVFVTSWKKKIQISLPFASLSFCLLFKSITFTLTSVATKQRSPTRHNHQISDICKIVFFPPISTLNKQLKENWNEKPRLHHHRQWFCQSCLFCDLKFLRISQLQTRLICQENKVTRF